MTLEQLRIFVAVAEREHVTQAARDLNLTQSATSAAVAALEQRYATRLFDRIGRRIALTEAGRLFLAEARAVLARAAIAEQVLIDLAGLARGSLAVAASQTVANYWLPPVLQRYRALHPGISVRLSIGNTEGVAKAVHEGAADLGFVEGEIEDPALWIDPVAEDELVLVAPAGHDWISNPPRRPAELAAGPWVVRERGSGTRRMFEAALPGLGLAPDALSVTLELPSNEAVRLAVEAGAGVAVMSRLVAATALQTGSLVAIDLVLPRRDFVLLRHKERRMGRAEQAFVDQIRPEPSPRGSRIDVSRAAAPD